MRGLARKRDRADSPATAPASVSGASRARRRPAAGLQPPMSPLGSFCLFEPRHAAPKARDHQSCGHTTRRPPVSSLWNRKGLAGGRPPQVLKQLQPGREPQCAAIAGSRSPIHSARRPLDQLLGQRPAGAAAGRNGFALCPRGVAVVEQLRAELRRPGRFRAGLRWQALASLPSNRLSAQAPSAGSTAAK